MFQYQATVVRIVDGDTAYLDIDLGFFICMTIDVRLYGVNTPETRGPSRAAGLKSKTYVEQAIPVGSTVVQTYKAEKYGRYLADIRYLPGSTDRDEIQAKGRLLNKELVEKELAVEYYP
jgi:micrococcal nuclease